VGELWDALDTDCCNREYVTGNDRILEDWVRWGSISRLSGPWRLSEDMCKSDFPKELGGKGSTVAIATLPSLSLCWLIHITLCTATG
jgi:hypothetical protein